VMLLLVLEPAIVESSKVAFVIVAGAVAKEKDRSDREKVMLSLPVKNAVVEFDSEALIQRLQLIAPGGIGNVVKFWRREACCYKVLEKENTCSRIAACLVALDPPPFWSSTTTNSWKAWVNMLRSKGILL